MKTIVTALSALLLIGHANAQAQTFPNRPIRMVIPFPAGGPTDVMGRLVGQKSSEFFGQPVVLDFKGGANAIVGTEAVARAAPDGYTVLMAPLSAVAINPVTYKSLPYNVQKDFAPVTEVVDFGLYLVIQTGLPVNSVASLIDHARKNPGKLTYASTGEGSPAHFSGVMLDDMTGTTTVHVPFKGSAPANTELMAGRVDFFFTSLTTVPAFVKAGKLKILAYAGNKRSLLNPDIPTMQESGYPNFWAGAYYSILTRAGTPASAIDRMVTSFNRALDDAETRKGLEAQDWQVLQHGSPRKVTDRIAMETKRWAALATKANIRFD